MERRVRSKSAINAGFLAIEDASRLTEVRLDLPAFFSLGTGGVGGPTGVSLFQQMSPFGAEVCAVTDLWVKDLRTVANRIADLGEKHKEVARALELFRQTDAVHPSHTLHLLGLFAVVELLITHNPKGSFDSLSHQIRTKITLLEKRFCRPLDYAQFGTTTKDKVWTRLYEFRSRIAHGASTDLRGSMQVLGSPKAATEFLRRATKLLVRRALFEPELVLDLREI